MRYVLLTVAAGMGLACGGVQPPATDEKPAGPKWEGPPVESADLFKAYQDDPAAAAVKYGNRTIRVRMTATTLRTSGDRVIIEHQSDPPNPYPHVEAVVPAGDARLVKTGQPLTVEGRVRYQSPRAVDLDGRVVP
jgi:hypothetical protein